MSTVSIASAVSTVSTSSAVSTVSTGMLTCPVVATPPLPVGPVGSGVRLGGPAGSMERAPLSRRCPIGSFNSRAASPLTLRREAASLMSLHAPSCRCAWAPQRVFRLCAESAPLGKRTTRPARLICSWPDFDFSAGLEVTSPGDAPKTPRSYTRAGRPSEHGRFLERWCDSGPVVGAGVGAGCLDRRSGSGRLDRRSGSPTWCGVLEVLALSAKVTCASGR